MGFLLALATSMIKRSTSVEEAASGDVPGSPVLDPPHDRVIRGNGPPPTGELA
jgi:hypothetical protein